MTELEIRKTQRELLQRLLRAKENPKALEELIEDTKIGMMQEDVALVEQRLKI